MAETRRPAHQLVEMLLDYYELYTMWRGAATHIATGTAVADDDRERLESSGTAQ